MNFINSPPKFSVPISESNDSFLVYRIFCVGRNYKKHIQEMGYKDKDIPFIYFLKSPDAVALNGAEIPIPSFTNNFQHEVELVVVIGKKGKNISMKDAGKHILGYSVGIDLTCRDIQNEAKQYGRPWTLAKSIPFSAPISTITTAKVCGNIRTGSIQLTVNNQTRQNSDIVNMIRSPEEIISILSGYTTLFPGDIIFTGTPEGVGKLQKGDTISARIEGLQPLTVSLV